MWHAQEHFNSYTQPLMNLVSALILARVQLFLFYAILCSFCFSYKIKMEEYPNLHNATLLQCFRLYFGENSRTFQDLIVEFMNFSRIFGNPGLFKDFLKKTRTFQDFANPVISTSLQQLPLHINNGRFFSYILTPWKNVNMIWFLGAAIEPWKKRTKLLLSISNSHHVPLTQASKAWSSYFFLDKDANPSCPTIRHSLFYNILYKTTELLCALSLVNKCV